MRSVERDVDLAGLESAHDRRDERRAGTEKEGHGLDAAPSSSRIACAIRLAAGVQLR
jgi:hypothetical protein